MCKNEKAVAPVATHSVGTDALPANRPAQSVQSVIDLTNDSGDGDELQRAIAASLQDSQGGLILGGQISREDQDISRILEASLLEENGKAGTKRKRGDIWFVDPLNPHERKRTENWPVGLKNVGNTCWFSAVIQSLFHLPKFRRLVLGFVPPSGATEENALQQRNLIFMQELRRLFALMIGSRKKYVDPSRAVEILKEAFTAANGNGIADNQQDVSEFQHKLLDWLEDAFKQDCSRPTSPATPETPDDLSRDNPMVELFYGQYKAEGTNEGKTFTNKETFGQFPLQVNGFHDIHESLEAAMAAGEIETVSNDTSLKSGQEQWFTRLPSMLTFELLRFQFNQQLGRPEKIHNKLAFPEVIYMDRYMECNKDTTRLRREEVKKLKEELVQLQTKLDKFMSYGSGTKRFPLQDVLQYALEFAETQPPTSLCSDVEMESPCNSNMHVESPDSAPLKDCEENMSIGTPSSSQLPASPNRNSSSGISTSPAPRHVTGEELHVLRECMKRWRTEVENDVKELQDGISQLESAVNSMYGDEEMKKFPYQLHAVLVHEGQAASGHYWAYVYDAFGQRWLKFNDIAVTESSWEEIVKESVGGYHNTSAYCLMYVDANRLVKIEDDSEQEMGQGDCDGATDATASLSTDLRILVEQHNKLFAQEIEEWDRAQLRKTTGVDMEQGDSEGVEESGSHQVSTQTHDSPAKLHLAQVHAQLALRSTLCCYEKAMESETLRLKGIEAAMVDAVNQEWQRLEFLSKHLTNSLPQQDPRLSHVFIYTLANAGRSPNDHFPPNRNVLTRIMLEQFTNMTALDKNQRAVQIRRSASAKLDGFLKSCTPKDEKLYNEIHADYHQFRQLIMYFLTGVTQFHQEQYQDAIYYLHHVVSMNRILTGKDGQWRWRGIDCDLLGYFQRQTLMHLNDVAASQFENDDDDEEAMRIMDNLVLPCLPALLVSSHQEDVQATEEIRGKWCSFLGQEISDKWKSEKLQDLISKLFDSPSEMRELDEPPRIGLHETDDLVEQYEQIMSEVLHGYEETLPVN
ncbi:ubiquitin carboxyl-terminal hydrolase 25-like isoform X2 [Lineus longissimus]